MFGASGVVRPFFSGHERPEGSTHSRLTEVKVGSSSSSAGVMGVKGNKQSSLMKISASVPY